MSCFEVTATPLRVHYNSAVCICHIFSQFFIKDFYVNFTADMFGNIISKVEK